MMFVVGVAPQPSHSRVSVLPVLYLTPQKTCSASDASEPILVTIRGETISGDEY